MGYTNGCTTAALQVLPYILQVPPYILRAPPLADTNPTLVQDSIDQQT
jgi:hypothetical protein